MSRGLRGVAIGSVVVLALLTHAGALRNGFVYDDIPQVVENPWIRDPGHLPEVFFSGAWSYAGTVSNYYRPVMHAVYTAAYAAWGLNPAGFHLVNLLLHAAVCALVFFVSELLLESTFAAFAVAALFAVHPVHTEAVSWIGGLPDLCAALFCLGSLWLHATGEERWRRGAAAAVLLLAVLSKEIAVVFPAVLLAWDLATGRERRLRGYLSYVAVLAVYFALRAHALGGFAPVRRHPELGFTAVIVNVLPLILSYARLFVFPAGLTVFHAFEPVTSLDASVVGGLVIVAATLAGSVALWRRARRAWFAVSLLVLPLLPALYIPGVGENPLAERYLYLPSLGFLYLVVFAVLAVSRSRRRWTPAIVAAGAILAATFSFASAARQGIWRSERTLWADAVVRSPGAPIAHYNLAVALKDEGHLDAAIAEYEAALRIQPSAVAFASLAAAQAASGREDQAGQALREALALDPGYAPAWNDLGVLELHAGRTSMAASMFRRAIELAPEMAEARQNLELAAGRLHSQAIEPAQR